MSALKSDFKPLFLHAVSKLESPWKTILPQLETLTVPEMVDLIGTTTLDVAGVYVKGQQCNFEKISGRLHNKDIADFLLVLHGLVLTMVTGDVHEHLTTYMRLKWVPWVLSFWVWGEPVFVIACQRSLKAVVEWMTDTMREASYWEACRQVLKNGDSALHMAVRRRQWDWAKWLLDHGASPYTKNKKGDSSIMLVAPHHEKLDLFYSKSDSHWYNALHDALVVGRRDSTWCVALLDRGADVNQLALYDSPIDSLIVLAKHGMDMNLGPLPNRRTPDQLKIFYLYGRRPTDWQHVIAAFPETEWIRFLHAFYQYIEFEVPEVYRTHVEGRQAITMTTRDILHRLLESR
jgi:hypothetical protein